MAEAKHRHLSSVRRLAAIMFTDIVGYTKMMNKDEQDTLSILRTNRETHKKLILDFGGQFLKEMGDGILASFENSSDAVICAAAIQKASKDNEIELRIGIHMGEVTFENNDVFGDGVNIASRLQPIAEPSQILISETVHHNVQNKPGISSTLLGQRELKNVLKAVTIYIVEVEDGYLTPVARTIEKKSIDLVKLIAIAAAVAFAMLFAGYFIGLNNQEPPKENPVIRSSFDLDSRLSRTGRHSLKFSPDGNYLCYVAGRKLYLKSLAEDGGGTSFAGIDDPREPVFSPDGKWIAYETEDKLMKVSISGRSPLLICDMGELSTFGMHWGDDEIIFSGGKAIYQVNPNGGLPKKIYPLANTDSFYGIWNPQLLPDKKSLLYSQTSAEGQWNVLWVPLEGSQEPEILIEQAMDARYLESGYIAYLKDQSLQVIPFNPDSKKITGDPRVLPVNEVHNPNDRSGQFAFNQHGSLVYYERGTNRSTVRHLAWVGLDGKKERISREPAQMMSPGISPDGQRIVVDQKDSEDGAQPYYSLTLYNQVLGTSKNFDTDKSSRTPVWAPDNVSLTYSVFGDGVYIKPVDLSYLEKLLFKSEFAQLGNWSNDGRYLVFTNDIFDIAYYDREDSSIHTLDFISTSAPEFYPRLSPDGNWLSFVSRETGESQVYIAPFPGPGQIHRISITEGEASVWSPDMSAIYFASSDLNGDFIAKAALQTEPKFISAEPEVLFYGDYATPYRYGYGTFTIHPDGDRFLMQDKSLTEEPSTSNESGPTLNLVVNWPGLIDK